MFKDPIMIAKLNVFERTLPDMLKKVPISMRKDIELKMRLEFYERLKSE